MTRSRKYLPYILLAVVGIVFFASGTDAMAQAGGAGAQLTWQSANTTGVVGSWFTLIMRVLLAVFIMSSIVLTVLAFKGLAADGQWKEFWSKIIGAVGIFSVPIIIYWLVGGATG